VIFTIMLLNLSKEELREAPVHPLRAIIIAALCIAGAAMTIIVFRDFPVAPATLDAGFGSIEAVGKTMLSDFLYPFEVISLVLLVAVVGVVLMAKKEI